MRLLCVAMQRRNFTNYAHKFIGIFYGNEIIASKSNQSIVSKSDDILAPTVIISQFAMGAEKSDEVEIEAFQNGHDSRFYVFEHKR